VVEYKTLDSLPRDARVKLRQTKQPEWLPPMLATLTEERISRKGWLFEPKFDGERSLVFRNGAMVSLYSRNQKLLNSKYPELIKVFEDSKLRRSSWMGKSSRLKTV
jgi:ATP-dependent DNA ligase